MQTTRKHTTLGPLVSIEGHTVDGERFTIHVADVKSGYDGLVESCVLHANTPDLVHDENGKLDLIYPTKTRRLDTPSRAVRDALDPTYTALHEGRAPGSYWRDLPRVGGELAKDALVIDAASYIKETLEADLHVYRHPIELSENRKPTLAISPNQELWFRKQGSVRVTERGIEDIMESTAIDRAIDSRPNPYTKENVQRAAMSSLYAGGAAVGEILLVNYAVENVEFLRTNVVGYQGAVAKAVFGILAAVGVDGMLSEQQDEYRPIAAGIGVGGIVGGVMQAIDTYKLANPTADTTPIPATFRDADARTAWMRLHPTRSPVPEVYAAAPAGASSRHWGNEWSGVPANQQWGRTG